MNVGKEVAALHAMTVKELRDKHLKVFGEATRSGHKQYLIRRIAWRIQSLAERARNHAAEIADDRELRMKDPGPTPKGAVGWV